MAENILHNEKELLRRISEGDEMAFRQVFHYYVPQLRLLIFKLTRSEFPVEDIVQEIFFKVWLFRDKLPEIVLFRSWLLKITFHACFGYLRKIKISDKAGRMLESAAASVQAPVEDQLDYKATLQLVHEAIGLLPEQAKRVYLLSRQQGMKLNEIAAELNLSLQTVKNTLGRALKSIRNYLEQYGIFLPLWLLWCALN